MKLVGPSWRVLLAGTLVGLATAGLAALNPLGIFQVNELKALDAQFALRGSRDPAAPIVIVSIDEDSFDALNLPWPWPRALHARFLEIVASGRPAAIGMDILFWEPSSRGPTDDRALAEAVARAGRVVLAAAITFVDDPSERLRLNAPLPEIREGAAGFGPAEFQRDADAFVRRATLRHRFQGRDWASFDVLMFRLAQEAKLARGPLPESREILINYRGGPGTFPWVPYHRVLSGEVAPEAFAGKIVLVGATTTTLHDEFPTPFAPGGGMPGVEIHANALETLLRGIPIRRAPAWLGWVLPMAAGVAGVWAASALRPLGAFGAVLALGLGYLGASHAGFLWARYWLPVVPVPVALLATYTATVAKNFVTEQIQTRRLSRFFSPAVAREIVRHKDDSSLGARRHRMTVLFSDIRGFTSMSERMPPEEVATFLREYLTAMTEAVFHHGGTVDKYIGDAIMALYNVPFEAPDHAAQAVRTALAFQERLKPLAERFAARYGGTLACGVGIHTGDAVVGTIGSEQRLEYTAIGDTINLGSRLEGLTKDFNVPVIISEATYLEVRDLFGTRDLGEVTVKGKAIPVKIYAVLPGQARREPRVSVEGRAAVSDGDVTVAAEIGDLSPGGVALRALAKPLARGAIVGVRLELPDRPRPVAIAKAEVMWAQEDRAGLRVVEASDEARAALAELAMRPAAARPEGATRGAGAP
ncbi:MAG TPA: CHASE2 domain-containing protein [Methylomirabilota bacterium]|nr:CHASE2 domain-containing protein [Methylomirabilota bacterium]